MASSVEKPAQRVGSAWTGESRVRIALLGDSTLDNKLWVEKRTPSVTEHLRGKISNGRMGEHAAATWTCHNLAVDGALINAVHDQLTRLLPAEPTYAIVSVGGNNGLGLLGEIENGALATSPLRLASAVHSILTSLRRSYEAMLDAVQARCGRVILCGFYAPCHLGRFAGGHHGGARRVLRRLATATGVAALNHMVASVSRQRRLPLIDLRAVFDSEWDYANPIEPSAQGGDKISENILHVIGVHPFDGQGQHQVYTRREFSQPPYAYAASVRGEDKSSYLTEEQAAYNRSADNAAYRSTIENEQPWRNRDA
eukprot:CAMPEP_0115856946 /NCGR_PEP_ID=MMETSP0287-20121206/15319_1 /TAXON_ID=412157 /ORGANISM="Chrysochromulina rotalis, Strain UIO044" /LENGTH=311 /DNA_ID=CAMNT_0003311145 /DNA_START=93 /DNA_END=1028 /DNA_ORIENTATION=+